MNRNQRVSLLSCLLYLALGGLFAQAQKVPAPKPYGSIPTARQLQWQETELYSLIHYSPTTYQSD